MLLTSPFGDGSSAIYIDDLTATNSIAAGSPRRGQLSITVGEATRSDDEPTDSPTPQGTPPKGTPIGRPRHNSHRYDMYTDIRPLRGRTQYTTAYRRLIGLRPLHLRLFKEAPFGDRYIAHGTLLRSPFRGQIHCIRYTAKKSLRGRL